MLLAQPSKPMRNEAERVEFLKHVIYNLGRVPSNRDAEEILLEEYAATGRDAYNVSHNIAGRAKEAARQLG